MLILLALAAAKVSPDESARLERLTALYEEICLRTFPDDKAVETLMVAKGARELSQEEVKVTMRDDPARAWQLPDLRATVWLEYPPFHACSVRWSAPAVGDLASYRAVADKYERAVGGFGPLGPMNADRAGIHIGATGETKPLANGGAENLFVIEQHVTDPARRGAGETGVVLRFVHQIAPPPPRGAS